MYKRTDRVIDYLLEEFIKLFNKAKVITKYDELNVISYSKELYTRIDELVKEAFLELAKSTAKEVVDVAEELITMEWLLGILNEYNPLTKYRYETELERKRQRFAEAVIASNENKEDEIEKALNYISRMMSQYALEVTDSALQVGYEQLGIKEVMWHTEEDDKVCEKCKKMNKKIYPIDKIPIKPHWNCRCYVLPVKGE